MPAVRSHFPPTEGTVRVRAGSWSRPRHPPELAGAPGGGGRGHRWGADPGTGRSRGARDGDPDREANALHGLWRPRPRARAAGDAGRGTENEALRLDPHYIG